ncbi:hypothetical protein CMO96_03355 [Candidatus Woesebacteria bacterium]|nr:hypothetical protein [Candidatus Woesebacteria bacterium]|tara:strand:- start:308 stop:568 length:261 start_codon:yes stop_codon:yes gene_type:complete
MSFVELKNEIESIKERNRRVESDKKWETSWIRRIFVAGSTYILILIVMYLINVEQPFLTALIPTVAYLISTASLGVLKEWWLKKRR